MKNRIHPYALIIGLLVAIAVLLILRHPIFSLFAGFIAVLLFDMALKRGNDRDKLE